MKRYWNKNRGMYCNIGTEEEKGSEIVKEAYKLCKTGPFNFKGNVEARDISGGYADVMVCDGFTGNVILKLQRVWQIPFLNY